jgi:Phosphate-starvation-inducible E family
MVVELLYTVQVSFREHTIVPEPFLIVGLVAVIRRILVITAETTETSSQDGSRVPICGDRAGPPHRHGAGTRRVAADVAPPPSLGDRGAGLTRSFRITLGQTRVDRRNRRFASSPNCSEVRPEETKMRSRTDAAHWTSGPTLRVYLDWCRRAPYRHVRRALCSVRPAQPLFRAMGQHTRGRVTNARLA